MFNWDGEVLAKSDPIPKISKFSPDELFWVFYLQLQNYFFLPYLAVVIDLELVVPVKFHQATLKKAC